MSFVLCLLSYVLCLMSYVLRILSYVLCFMSYKLFLMSYVIQAEQNRRVSVLTLHVTLWGNNSRIYSPHR